MQIDEYLMVLPVRHFRVSQYHVAVEGAFAEHLRMMRAKISRDGCKLVVSSPAMDDEAYKSKKETMAIIDEEAEEISFCALYVDDNARSLGAAIRNFVLVMRKVYSLSKKSFCIHSGLSWNLWIPFEFASIVFGIILRRRTVFVVDIDYRKSALMSYRVGDWSWKSYAMCRYVYDTARSIQLRIAVRYCSLVLLKGRKMVTDFGSGRPNVKYMLDASHGLASIIDVDSLEKKIELLTDQALPLRLVYFGRLTAYKGIDRCIEAVALANKAGANVELDIIGGGEELDALRSLCTKYNADSFVRFLGALPFNQQFFFILSQYHLLLAAPLREDTPRSALDAMAAGVPYLAFDTYYYRELLESGAGKIVEWLNVEAMAMAIAELAKNRTELVGMIERSVEFARANTQEIWLERRLAWIFPPEQSSSLQDSAFNT